MAKTAEAKTPSDFLRLLEESRILGEDQLRVVRQMLPETSTSKMLARRLIAKGLLTRWQAGQLLVGWTKLRLGNHRLRGQIGRGEYGRVFLAEHMQLQREVAVKTLSRRFTQRKEIVDTFLKDARQVAALDHRNLVHVFDIDRDDDQYYMVMEYIVGRDLQRLVAEDGRLPFSVVADYVAQTADGLGHAHALGVIHRDLRPENLMLDDKGGIKILGMGVGRLAVLGYASAGKEESDGRERVPDYRSPEQRRGETQGDVPSDIFSLGAVAWYLLTGRPPVRGPVDGPDMDWARDGRSHLLSLCPDTPPSLLAILETMTAADPSQRFASAHEVRRAWQEWLAHESGNLLHGESELPYRVVEGCRRAIAVPPPIPSLRVPAVQKTLGRALGKSSGPSSVDVATRGRWKWSTARYVLGAAGLACLALISLAAYIWWPGQGGAVATPVAALPAVKEPLSRPELHPHRQADEDRESTARDATTRAPAGSAVEPAGDSEGKLAASKPAAEPSLPAPHEEAPKEDAPRVTANPPPAIAKPPAATAAGPPPADAVQLLQNLPAAVDLPALNDSTSDENGRVETILAPLEAAVADQVSVALLGGEHAAGKMGRFVLQPEGADTKGSWKFLLIDARNASDNGQPIGHLRLHDGHIVFGWAPEAGQQIVATNLRNCVVRFTLAASTHDLRLRSPQQVAPLTVDLTRQEVSERWQLKAPPDAQYTRLEITRLEPPFPAARTLNPATPIEADNGKVVVLFGEDPSDQVLLLELAAQLKTTLRLECKAYFQVSPKVERIPLIPKKLETTASFVANRQVQHNLLAQQLRAALTQVPATDPRHNQLAQNLQQAETELAETSQATGRLTALADLRSALAAGGEIHFRLFYLADDCEVDLLVSSPAAE